MPKNSETPKKLLPLSQEEMDELDGTRAEEKVVGYAVFPMKLSLHSSF
jgi:hypothetical protein